jgi:hypothetical protein
MDKQTNGKLIIPFRKAGRGLIIKTQTQTHLFHYEILKHNSLCIEFVTILLSNCF